MYVHPIFVTLPPGISPTAVKIIIIIIIIYTVGRTPTRPAPIYRSIQI
jgi:hypothetical protein